MNRIESEEQNGVVSIVPRQMALYRDYVRRIETIIYTNAD